jgi:adenylate cyclase
MLCVSAFLSGGSMADTGFDELRELALTTGDKVSLAMAMAGRVSTLVVHTRLHEASRLASELTGLLESIGDPALALGLLYTSVGAKYRTGEIAETLRLTQWMIDLAEGDPAKGNVILGSPLAAAIMLRGCARCCLGDPRWRGDIDAAATMLRSFDAPTRAVSLNFKYTLTVPDGVLVPDAGARQETAELLEVAERSGHDFTLAYARFLRGLTLVTNDGLQRKDGFALLAAAREAAVEERFTGVLAQARGNERAYQDFRDRYHAMANSLGFEGHIAWAEAMT